MSDHYDSKIVALAGDVDGVNTTFVTPSRYVSGTIIVIVNGQVYTSDEDDYGWSETDETTIEMNSAPLAGDVVQAFYQDLDTQHEGTSFDNVVGSPFDPNGVLP